MTLQTSPPGPSARQPRVLDWIDRSSKLCASIAGVVVAIMMAHIVLDVAGRFLGSPLPGTLAFISFWWMPCIIFLGLAATEREGEHIRVTLIIDKLTSAMGRTVRSTADVVAVAVIAVLCYFGTLGAVEATILQKIELGTLDVSVWPPRIAMAVGLFVYFAQILAGCWRLWKQNIEPVQPDEDEIGLMGA